jgi:FKBP-type peptidyl-prolyl cis-trans isomerase SlyD
MKTTENKYITVAYELYAIEEGEKELVEKATAEEPFQFITGLGTTLDAFENQISPLSTGKKFDFTIPVADAYGEYEDESVLELPKSIFEINGRFDSEKIYADSVVPLMDSEGHRMNGTVVEVKEDVVIMDMNHPLAGADLAFKGVVLENRAATNEEIQGMLNLISGEGGCRCGCEGNPGEEGCGCSCGEC